MHRNMDSMIKPMAQQMPYSSKDPNAIPNRRPSPHRKNVTGIYVGIEATNNALPTKTTSIPPLARPRATLYKARTPTEERRYSFKYKDDANTTLFVVLHQPNPDHKPKLTPYKKKPFLPALPHLPPSQYPVSSIQKMVELLRIREERRGFSGNVLKNRREAGEDVSPRRSPAPFARAKTDFWTITKQNPRHYTEVNNSGVSHRELLVAAERESVHTEVGSSVGQDVIGNNSSGVREKNQMDELVDCYRKVCKGNMDSLQQMLPQKSGRKQVKYTGFSVRSYRNPKQIEIGIDFPPPEQRPRTVLGAPPGKGYTPKGFYFFKAYQPHQSIDTSSHDKVSVTSDSRNTGGRASKAGRRTPRPLASPRPENSNNVAFYEMSFQKQVLKDYQPDTPRVSPTPAADSVIDETHQTRSKSSTSTKVIPVVSPSSSAKGIESNDTSLPSLPSPEDKSVPIIDLPPPAEQATENTQDSSKTSLKEDQDTEEMAQTNNNAIPIVIGLEDESGTKVPVKIDEPTNETDFSERVLKTKNDAVEIQKVPMKSRNEELQELLKEHAQIIQEVQDMETRVETPGSDKENTTLEQNLSNKEIEK